MSNKVRLKRLRRHFASDSVSGLCPHGPGAREVRGGELLPEDPCRKCTLPRPVHLLILYGDAEGCDLSGLAGLLHEELSILLLDDDGSEEGV